MSRNVRIEFDMKIESPPGMPVSEVIEGALQAAIAWPAGLAGWRAQKVRVDVGGYDASYTLLPVEPRKASLTGIPGGDSV